MGCNSCVAFQTYGQPGLYFLSVLPVACEGGLGCAGPTQLTIRDAARVLVLTSTQLRKGNWTANPREGA